MKFLLELWHYLLFWKKRPNLKNYIVGVDPYSEKISLPKDFVVVKGVIVNGENYIQFTNSNKEDMEKLAKSITDKFWQLNIIMDNKINNKNELYGY